MLALERKRSADLYVASGWLHLQCIDGLHVGFHLRGTRCGLLKLIHLHNGRAVSSCCIAHDDNSSYSFP